MGSWAYGPHWNVIYMLEMAVEGGRGGRGGDYRGRGEKEAQGRGRRSSEGTDRRLTGLETCC